MFPDGTDLLITAPITERGEDRIEFFFLDGLDNIQESFFQDCQLFGSAFWGKLYAVFQVVEADSDFVQPVDFFFVVILKKNHKVLMLKKVFFFILF